jgi:hypothetical protein
MQSLAHILALAVAPAPGVFAKAGDAEIIALISGGAADDCSDGQSNQIDESHLGEKKRVQAYMMCPLPRELKES